jgi:VanZ family protein
VNRKILKLALWFCVLVILTVIFYFSSQPGVVSTYQSNSFMGMVFSRIWPPYNALSYAEKVAVWSQWSRVVRKWGHFCVFAFLGFFLYAATRVSNFKKIKKPAPFSAGASLFYAAADEIHQSFVPGRSAQAADALLDFAG